MTVEIIIRDDSGDVVANHTARAAHPSELKFKEKPLLDNSYEIWGFTYQPHIRVRSNWVALQQGGLISR